MSKSTVEEFARDAVAKLIAVVVAGFSQPAVRFARTPRQAEEQSNPKADQALGFFYCTCLLHKDTQIMTEPETDTAASHHHLRHHAPRRRAIARRQHEPGREAGDRPGAGRVGGGRDRGRLSHRLARRLQGRPADCPGGPRGGDLRAGPLPHRRHRPRLGSGAVCPAAADPRLPGHQRHPSRA